MSFVFLDIDGVLNSDLFYSRDAKARMDGDVAPECIAQLNYLLSRTRAKVIISSNWRHHVPLKEIRQVFCARGFRYPKRIVGKTPNLGEGAVRGYEILTYLRRRKALSRPFVAIDDTPDMDGLEGSVVRTSAVTGMTRNDAERALDILSKRKPRKRVAERSEADELLREVTRELEEYCG